MPSSGDAKKLSRRVARHELIGLLVEVQSPHTGWDSLVGRIVDETKHTFVVERTPAGPAVAEKAAEDRTTGFGRSVVVPKRGQTFLFRVGDGCALVQGDDIMFQPEDRTKRIKG